MSLTKFVATALFYLTICRGERPSLTSNPNIMFIVVDDLPFTQDWYEAGLAPKGTSLYEHTVEYREIDTPKIQAVMDEAIIITRSYSAGTMCSPSRYALLTGRYPSRCEFAQKSTIENTFGDYDDTLGTYVNVAHSKIYGTNDDSYNLAAVLKSELSYKTGMFGKWHLTPGNYGNLGCYNLESTVDASLYENCRSSVTDVGFDDVDSFYFGNIESGSTFSHNIEWKVAEAKKFIHHTLSNGNNFFAYLSLTLAHEPDAYEALQRNDGFLFTPKGTLTGADRPGPPRSGMKPRSTLLTAVDDAISENNVTDAMGIHYFASVMWIDDAIGAIVQALQNENVYDNTFLVIIGDHGIPSKQTLYEHGTRHLQVIRFPPYWPATSQSIPYKTPDEFITSSVDLAAVVYDMLGISSIPSTYSIDGTSWIDDLFDQIDGATTEAECCTMRFSDLYNSHAIKKKDYTYIYRAGSDVTETLSSGWYPNIDDEEQLYEWSTDPITSEQTNIISTADATVIAEFREAMTTYITDIACPVGVTNCKTPI